MKSGFIILLGVAFFQVPDGFAREQTLLARVTVYWHSEGEQQRACSNGTRLKKGHCAVDPKKIPYGSKVLFEDGPCVAVDSGPAVVNRKAARLSGRTSLQKNALVIDRYFESKKEALAWAGSHPHFMNVQIVPPGAQIPPTAGHTLTDIVEADGSASTGSNLGITASHMAGAETALSYLLAVMSPLSTGAFVSRE